MRPLQVVLGWVAYIAAMPIVSTTKMKLLQTKQAMAIAWIMIDMIVAHKPEALLFRGQDRTKAYYIPQRLVLVAWGYSPTARRARKNFCVRLPRRWSRWPTEWIRHVCPGN